MKSPMLQSKAAPFVSISHTEISHDRSQRFHGSKMVQIQFMGKKSIKTKKESTALETYILHKKESAKWSKYNNPLISNCLLLQPEVSEWSNTCISHKNFQVLYRKGILNKVGLAGSPLKIKKPKKNTPTMLKHWNKVFKQTVLWRKLFVISATRKVPQEGFPVFTDYKEITTINMLLYAYLGYFFFSTVLLNEYFFQFRAYSFYITRHTWSSWFWHWNVWQWHRDRSGNTSLEGRHQHDLKTENRIKAEVWDQN